MVDRIYSAEIVESDSESSKAKEKLLLDAGHEALTWFDLKCGECESICCRPCTANGDPNQCSKTKFEACSICGHASSKHYAVAH